MPHTPEPWSFELFTLDRIYIRRCDPETGAITPIAIVIDTGMLSPGELEMNAELLVRAPALLKALLELPHKPEIEEFLSRHCTGMDDHDQENCRKCAQMREELHALLDNLPLFDELQKAGVL